MQIKLKIPSRIRQVFLLFSFFLLSSVAVFSQDRFTQIETQLKERAKIQKGLNNPVNISVNHSPLQEIIRAIAIENQLNVSVDVSINEQPSYNFANASVAEVFVFLCKEHNLYLEYTGNIIAFKRYVAPEAAPVVAKPKEINLSYNKANKLVIADLQRDTLYNVIRKLSQLAGVNIQLEQGLHKELITMSVVDQDIESVIKRLAANNEVQKIADDFYSIKKSSESAETASNSSSRGRTSSRTNSRNTRGNSGAGNNSDIMVELKDSLMNLSAYNAPLKDIVEALSTEAGVNFFLFKEPKGNLTVNIVGASYDNILEYILNTSEFTYKVVNKIYVIGERKDESLRFTTVHQMMYRTVEDLANVIPADIKKNVEVKEFPELNSLVLSGAQLQINEIIKFLKMVDKVVPVVLIEVMIVDINKSHSISTGLKVGRDESISSGGSINDGGATGLVTTLDAGTLNQIVNSLSNLGIFNLGVVGDGFYVQMSNLEENGSLTLHSTPKLATLNGHEAKLTIGETVYYPIDQTNVIGAQSPQVVQTRTYNSVNADLAVTIKPMVSGDDQITLEITVSQSTFGAQEGAAPPGLKKREFQSLIRMKNQEMVILGGLEQDSKSKNGSGVPFLARIPIIKWFFSNTNSSSDDSQLTIFIRPTIIY